MHLLGIAAGATSEFLDHNTINEETVQNAMKLEGGGVLSVGPGQITDDSEMAMCLLSAAHENV